MATLVKNIYIVLFYFNFLKWRHYDFRSTSLLDIYQGEPPTGAGCEKWEDVSSLKGRACRGTCNADQGATEPERGEIPLRGRTGFCSQKKEIRFMSSQASSGCKHAQSCVFLCWFRALGQNAVAQLNTLEHTDGVGEWVGQKFTRVDHFFLAKSAFPFPNHCGGLFNYLPLCFLLKCWFAFLFNLAQSGGLNVSLVEVACRSAPRPEWARKKLWFWFFFSFSFF